MDIFGNLPIVKHALPPCNAILAKNFMGLTPMPKNGFFDFFTFLSDYGIGGRKIALFYPFSDKFVQKAINICYFKGYFKELCPILLKTCDFKAYLYLSLHNCA
jgi:hypothetical protein